MSTSVPITKLKALRPEEQAVVDALVAMRATARQNWDIAGELGDEAELELLEEELYDYADSLRYLTGYKLDYFL